MIMRRLLIFAVLVLIMSNNLFAQKKSLEAIPLDSTWKQKIYELAPEKPTAIPTKEHKVLLFSLFTGFNHWVIPHANHVITALGEKTGAYQVIQSADVFLFEKETLKQFDAIVLNNNCSVGPRRDLFLDALDFNTTLSEESKVEKAAEFEQNLLEYVKNGGGLAVLHGGIVMQNNSEEVSKMIGGSFDYHPPQQDIELHIEEKGHPLTAAFNEMSFIHFDEPYFFKNAYNDKNFRPLLSMEISKIKKVRHKTDDKDAYVSWIKRYGEGRVFYCSPSHNAQSYEKPALLLFYLNGMQYVLGDLKCDDSPLPQ